MSRSGRAADPQGQAASADRVRDVVQIAELCENTRRGARGLIVPVSTQIGSPNEPDLLPATGAQLDRLKLRPARAGARRRVRARFRSATPPRGAANVHRRPPVGRKPENEPSPREVQGRMRGPDQSPQTPLRTTSLTSQRPRRSEDLGGLGDPGLQPRQSRHPHRLTASRPALSARDANLERPRLRPSAAVPHSRTPAVYPGEVASTRPRTPS